MGQDIHLYMEARQGDRWEAVPGNRMWADKFPIEDGGWYDTRHGPLFEMLKTIGKEGLPRDLSPEVQEAAADPDAHTHRWLGVAELTATAKAYGVEWDSALSAMIETSWRRGVGSLNVRVVYWFDN